MWLHVCLDLKIKQQNALGGNQPRLLKPCRTLLHLLPNTLPLVRDTPTSRQVSPQVQVRLEKLGDSAPAGNNLIAKQGI
jgi:hypothetical protein